MERDIADLHHRVDQLVLQVRDLTKELDLLRRKFRVHTEEHGA